MGDADVLQSATTDIHHAIESLEYQRDTLDGAVYAYYQDDPDTDDEDIEDKEAVRAKKDRMNANYHTILAAAEEAYSLVDDARAELMVVIDLVP
ncbi:hypothetical protein HDU85_006552 [Gaertneriomyces sp. JEL0708]|nr:hypothetical protein HDU85_006552 [Gaertneriomyces sp. JEL0708]